MRSRARPVAHSTIRMYQQTLTLLCGYMTVPAELIDLTVETAANARRKPPPRGRIATATVPVADVRTLPASSTTTAADQ